MINKIRRAIGPWRVRSCTSCSSAPLSFFSSLVRAREAALETLLAKNDTLGDAPGALLRPLALQGSICSIFWSIGKASKNDDFLASQQNVKNQTIRRTWDAHVAILDTKTWLLRSTLVSFCYCFFEWPKIKKSVCFSILFNGFGPSKTIDFPIVFSSIFHFFSKPLPGTIFRRSQRRTFLKKLFLVPFPIFMVFQKAPFGRPFRPSRRPKPSPPNCPERPFRDPAFHETTVILVPLGPSVFKTSFFRWWLATFPFFLLFFVLCVICHFYHIRWNKPR